VLVDRKASSKLVDQKMFATLNSPSTFSLSIRAQVNTRRGRLENKRVYTIRVSRKKVRFQNTATLRPHGATILGPTEASAGWAISTLPNVTNRSLSIADQPTLADLQDSIRVRHVSSLAFGGGLIGAICP
jgi:hypothetical protein